MSHVHCPPLAAGVYSPDAFTDSGDANGVLWGLSHIEMGELDGEMWTYLIRFDCDLDRRMRRVAFHEQWEMNGRYLYDTYFRNNMKLPESEKSKIINEELSEK